MALLAAVTAPLIAAIRVLWSRCQVLQDDRASTLREAADHERRRRDEIERALSEIRSRAEVDD